MTTNILLLVAMACLFMWGLFMNDLLSGLPNSQEPRQEVVLLPNNIEKLVNVVRLGTNLRSYARDSRLVASACLKAKDLIEKDYWSHFDPNGGGFAIFINKVGYWGAKIGENLAYGYDTDEEVVDAWMASPSHRSAILDNYTEQGICAVTGEFMGNIETVYVQHLGIPID